MSKHLVKWNKPVVILIGKNQLIESGDIKYVSKCGRFEIRRRHFASGRNGSFNAIGYTFTVVATGKFETVDTLGEAKTLANWEIDPNWEP